KPNGLVGNKHLACHGEAASRAEPVERPLCSDRILWQFITLIRRKKNEHSLCSFGCRRRSHDHDRAGSSTTTTRPEGTLEDRGGEDLVAKAMEQAQSRIRQGQGEVGLLPPAEQGAKAAR